MTDASDPSAPIPGVTKIFPRNLTARAAYKVRGNPASARPESGVDNTHPGLEFDQRNLDRFFFPGLSVEFQFTSSARVTGIDPSRLAPGSGVLASDAWTDLSLYYIYGKFGDAPDRFALREVSGLDGYDVLRTVRDLEPGPVLVVIGRTLSAAAVPQFPAYSAMLFGLLQDPGTQPAEISLPPVRDQDGTLLLAALAGQRAAFVDPAGVLDPDIVAAGELTRSLCAPWQWDFADCGCHYWASSRPDIVIGPDGGAQALNFQRDRAAPPQLPPAATYAAWTANEMTQQTMLNNWQTLSFVIGEQERDVWQGPAWAKLYKPMTLPQIIEKLQGLAQVEHALAVNYLYAHYSVDAPAVLPSNAPEITRRRYDAARQVFLIAVDEMRHFRWVNEALALLGAQLSFGRTTIFHLPTKDGDRTAEFTTSPLTLAVLDTLIDVESPSRKIGSDDVDGMYTNILGVLTQPVEGIDATTRQRLAEVIKLIIDEGHDHWEKLLVVKRLLQDDVGETYLRLGAPHALSRDETDPIKREDYDLQQMGKLYYETLLDGIMEAFHQPALLRGEIMEQAHRVMRSLHELAHKMAARGVTPLFSLPQDRPPDADATAAQV